MKAQILKDKQLLRDQYRKRLRHQSLEERREKSRIISDLVFDLPAYRKAKAVMLYVAMDEEVDTRHIIKSAFQEKKHVLLPVVLEQTGEMISAELIAPGKMKPGKYGIMEPDGWSSPFPPHDLDMVIVPGLAFDKKNFRLGRGKGYYDQFLSKLNSKVATVGLAFDVQLAEEIPVEPHDVKLDLVVHN
ncbi:MAG: 5-formyltetrahydrofolate cyclo-ligase [Candidatus Omnitrophica bacterium]|nr:5-formyltetrahydrofolate cyclo-ligase [Candidatus Omnitrophota bacterium]